MKKNMGTADRIVRFIIAIVLVDLAVMGPLSGAWQIAALVVSAIFVVTALASNCPLYSLLGISTCPKKKTSH